MICGWAGSGLYCNFSLIQFTIGLEYFESGAKYFSLLRGLESENWHNCRASWSSVVKLSVLRATEDLFLHHKAAVGRSLGC